MYTHTYILYIFSIRVHRRILNIVPHAMQQDLVVYPPFVFVNKVLLEHSCVTCLMLLAKATFVLQQQSGIVVTQSISLIRPNMFTVWAFTEEVCQTLFQNIRPFFFFFFAFFQSQPYQLFKAQSFQPLNFASLSVNAFNLLILTAAWDFHPRVCEDTSGHPHHQTVSAGLGWDLGICSSNNFLGLYFGNL